MSQDEEQGFKVNDRRRFDAEGNQRTEAEQRRDVDAPASGDGEAAQTGSGPLPTIDFTTFVLSLSTSAMVHLGQAPHPDGSHSTDLELAQQTIDILGMLREKTEGNLTADETKLLGDMLYDLRLRFVAARK